MEITVGQLALLIGGDVSGDPNITITGVGTVENARYGDVVLAENHRYLERALVSDASCIIALKNGAGSYPKCVIQVSNPAGAFVSVLSHFSNGESGPTPGIGPGAVIEKDVELSEGCSIGANCHIGRGARIGAGCVLYPNVCIGERVVIGSETLIYSNAVVYADCEIGSRVILHSGVVIGADGFGYTCDRNGLVKYPHIGTVQIGDDVEIGANSAVDRAKVGATVIGRGTKIDNLVHIAHNVKIGENCVVVAQTGVAGSVEIGNGVTLAAQAGVKDHIKIEDGCVIAARAGVIGNISKGSVVSGFPAREHNFEKRVQAARLHLPEILQRLKALENELKELRNEKKSD